MVAAVIFAKGFVATARMRPTWGAPVWHSLETIVAHPDVGLFHELVHALHNQSGVTVADENEAERRVIGIGPYLKCPVTENAYRNARDLPLRCCRDRAQL